MRTIVLTRVGAYKPRLNNPTGIEFIQNVPVSVPDALAETCLESGNFMDASFAPPQDSILDEFGIGKLVVGGGYVVNPKNTLENDDLNGKRVMFRRNGGIGDMVFLGIMAQYIRNKYPKCILWAGVSDELTEFVSIFSAFDRVYPLNEALRDEIIHACDYIVEFNGVLGSEASNSEDNKDYFLAHWERAAITDTFTSIPVLDIDNMIGNLSINSATNDVLKRNGLEEGKYVTLLLGTSNPLKRLTVDQLRNIANTYIGLSKDGKAPRILCIGGRGDRYFMPEHPHIRVETELPLVVSADVMRRSALVVGADTGLMQLAGACKVPTLSLWGPTDPSLSFSHYNGDKRVMSQQGKVDCAPCRRIRTAFCPYYEAGYTKCMKAYDPTQIANYAYEMAQETENPICYRGPDSVTNNKNSRAVYKVAVLLDNGNHYTGGGYYTWSLAKVIAEKPRVEVTVFTDADVAHEFVYARGDVLPRSSSIKVSKYADTLTGWDSTEYYDLVIGTPPLMGKAAIKYAKSRNAKCVLLVYETPNYIKEYRQGIDGDDGDYWKDYKASLKKADAVWVISREVERHFAEWIPEAKGKTWVVRPTVNSAVADIVHNGVTVPKKDDNVFVIISRNVQYKRLAEAIHCIASDVAPNLKKRPVLHVVGHLVGRLKNAQENYSNTCDVVLHENMTDEEKWKLLMSARIVVHPSDFEGFGIPVAEGLYAGASVFAHALPVFTEEFKDAPYYYTDYKDLATQIESCVERWDNETEVATATKKKAFASKHFAKFSQMQVISKCFNTSLGFTQARFNDTDGTARTGTIPIRVAVVSPWNTQCGIAETTKDVVKNIKATFRVFSYTDIPTIMQDEEFVVRCWDRGFAQPSTLLHYLQEFEPDIVHIHHEHSLFQTEENFFSFIKEVKKSGAKVIVTLHTYRVDAFTDRLMTTADLVTTTKVQEGMGGTFMEVPLPVTPVACPDKALARHALGIRPDEFVVGTFGMWQEHKGFAEFMDSYDTLVHQIGDNVKYLISGAAPPKSQYLMECRRKHFDRIKGGLFIMFEDYPPLEEVVTRLAACDVLVFNYSVAHHSSASAAIRTAMMAQVPIVCAESPMFSEFSNGEHVLKAPFGDTGKLVEALIMLKNDQALGAKLVDNCNKYCSKCTPQEVAKKWDLVYSYVMYGEEEPD